MRQTDLRWNPRHDLELYRHVKPWVLRGTEAGQLRPVEPRACRPNLSSKRRQPNVVVLRCECMAETRGAPSRRFFGYDPIGEYRSLQEAMEAWRGHAKQEEITR